jgi:glycosyltransferase involved in cell wall biosynthesis
MTTRMRFLLAQRACAELYPPVLHQAALLSEVADVTLLDALAHRDDPRIQTNGKVMRLRVKKKSAVAPSTASDLLLKIKWLKDYRREFRRQASANTDVVIAYEPDAINLLLSTNLESKRIKRIAHLHEITQEDPYAPLTARLRLKLMLLRLMRADLVILPDKHRAHLLQSAVRLKTEPQIVMNCPRRLSTLPNSLLLPLLSERRITTNKIVHYQGSVGPDHGLEAVIESMRFWPADAVFVIVGGGRERYFNSLDALAAAEGVKGRVIFAGRIPYDQVFAYAIGASVGVTLLDPSVRNWELSAGASNKRFEYAALGIPQVTNDGPGIQDLFGDTGIASIANHRDVADIGRKISRYLNNEAWGQEVGAKARRVHLQSYNYEQQFQKVLELIT